LGGGCPVLRIIETAIAFDRTKACEVPLDTCSSFGIAAEFLSRRGLAGKVSKSEMRDNVSRSKELGPVLNIDNVRKKRIA
jgi:hypothetical protein